MPFVVTMTVVVDDTARIGAFPATMPVFAEMALHDGAAAHVPLNVTVNGLAGDPVPPIVTSIALSEPATDGDVPHEAEHVGGVACAVRYVNARTDFEFADASTDST